MISFIQNFKFSFQDPENFERAGLLNSQVQRSLVHISSSNIFERGTLFVNLCYKFVNNKTLGDA